MELYPFPGLNPLAAPFSPVATSNWKWENKFVKSFFLLSYKNQERKNKRMHTNQPKRSKAKEEDSNQARSNLTDNHKSPYTPTPKGRYGT